MTSVKFIIPLLLDDELERFSEVVSSIISSLIVSGEWQLDTLDELPSEWSYVRELQLFDSNWDVAVVNAATYVYSSVYPYMVYLPSIYEEDYHEIQIELIPTGIMLTYYKKEEKEYGYDYSAI